MYVGPHLGVDGTPQGPMATRETEVVHSGRRGPSRLQERCGSFTTVETTAIAVVVIPVSQERPTMVENGNQNDVGPSMTFEDGR